MTDPGTFPHRLNRRALLSAAGGMMVGGAVAARANTGECTSDPADYAVLDQLFWIGESFVWIGFQKCSDQGQYALLRQKPGQPAEVVTAVDDQNSCRHGMGLSLLVKSAGTLQALDLNGQFVLRRLDTDGSNFAVCSRRIGRKLDELDPIPTGVVAKVSAGIPQDPDPKIDSPFAYLVCKRLTDRYATELLLLAADGTQQRKTVDWPLAWHTAQLFPDYQSGGWIGWPGWMGELVQQGFPGIPVGRISRELDVELTWVPLDRWVGQAVFFPVGPQLGATSSHASRDNARLGGVYLQTETGWDRRFASDVTPGSLGYSPDGRFLGWQEVVTWRMSFTGVRYIPRIEDLAAG